MKRLLCGILFTVLLFSVIAIVGCNNSSDKIKPFAVGAYESFEKTDNEFIKVKFVISPIDKQEFESANAINVIKNDSKNKENNVYYNFELFLYDDSKSDYVPATVSDISSSKQKNIYDGTVKYVAEDKNTEYSMRLFYGIPYSEITLIQKNTNEQKKGFGALCVHNIEGVFETFGKIENEIFTKMQYDIKPISKEEYDKANGINVIENHCFRADDADNVRYCSFEVKLFDGSKAFDIDVKISECSYRLTTASYYGVMEYEHENLYFKRNFDFYYDEPYPTIEFYKNEELKENLYLKFKPISY